MLLLLLLLLLLVVLYQPLQPLYVSQPQRQSCVCRSTRVDAEYFLTEVFLLITVFYD